MKGTLLLIIAAVLLILVSRYSPRPKPLRQRAAEFLELPTPEYRGYVPDPIILKYIRKYAREGEITLDEKMKESLSLVILDIPTTKTALSKSPQGYVNESANILKGILGESYR